MHPLDLYIGSRDLGALSGGYQIKAVNRHGDELSSREGSRPLASPPAHASSGRPGVVWHAKAAPRRRFPAAPLTRTPRVSVVIPALNEAENLEHVLPALPDGLFEVILVDGASVDSTVETAKRLRPDVRVVRQTRRGKGNAMACGFAACRGDIVVMLDADGSADPGEIPRFVDALVKGADFAKGSRGLDGGGSADITRVRSLGNRFLSFLVNRLCNSGYTDLCYGYNAFWAATCLPVLDLDWQSPAPAEGDGRLWGDGFEIETLINVRVAHGDLLVVEVPSYERPRLHGVSNLNAGKDGLRVLRTILSEDRRARRLRKRQCQAQRQPSIGSKSDTRQEPVSEAREGQQNEPPDTGSLRGASSTDRHRRAPAAG